MSLNVRGFGSPARQAVILEDLKVNGGDIYCLQECFFNRPPKLPDWVVDYIWSPVGDNRNAGVGIIIANRNIHIISHVVLVPGRLLMADLVLFNQKFRLFNLYAPANRRDRPEVFEVLKLHAVGRRPCVIMGDFNTIRFLKDRVGTVDAKLNANSAILNSIIQDLHLNDAHIVLDLVDPYFTFFSESGRAKSRIDLCLFSEALKCSDVRHRPVVFSDHVAVYVDLCVRGDINLGSGIWKLNSLLLQDEHVKAQFNKLYNRWVHRKKDFNDILGWWDWIKKKIKVFFQKKSRDKNISEKRRYISLQARLATLYSFRNMGFDMAEEIEHVRGRIKEVLTRRGKQIIFQAKVKYLEQDEKCSRFFFKKACGEKGVFEAVYDEEGNECKGDDVLDCVTDFYERLYKGVCVDESDSRVFDMLEDNLDEDDRVFLQKEVEEAEVWEAVASMAANKTPGGDGLPSEFFKMYWDIVKGEVVEVFRCIMGKGTLSESMKMGVVVLIYKKGDRKDVRNWRPISLLNSDYKVFAKMIARRLSRVISKMVSVTQTCAVPGRRSSENLILIRDIINFCKDRNSSIILTSFDLEKAFDKANHGFLWEVLKRMGVPQHLVKVLKGLYWGISSRVLVNGRLGRAFFIKSGVRQGCPLSPILFICFIDPLLRMIQRDKVVRGFLVPGSGGGTVKCLGYMDDVVVVCQSVVGVKRVKLLLSIFCICAGMSVNWSKCSMGVYGRHVESVDDQIGRAEDGVRILGIVFDQRMKGEVCWNEVGEKVAKKLRFWCLRKLSVYGKVLVIKAVILPLILYTSNIFPPGEIRVRKINKLLFTFLWGSKIERVKREYVCRRECNGGLSFPNVRVFLLLQYWFCVVRILENGGLCAGMVAFMGGWLFRRWGWLERDSRLPVAFVVARDYWILEKFRVEFRLAELGEKERDKVRVKKWLFERENVCNLKEVNASVAGEVWKKMNVYGVTNVQREIVWMSLHECLATRWFMRGRDLCVSDICPRENCGGVEDCEHVFWGCEFAKEVINRSQDLVKEIIGVRVSGWKMMMYGLGTLGKGKQKLLWLLLCALKEVLWEARNLYAYKYVSLSSKQCIGLWLSKLYFFYMLDKKREEIDAEGIWKFKKWRVLIKS